MTEQHGPTPGRPRRSSSEWDEEVDSALEFAAEEAVRAGCGLHLVHAVHLMPDRTRGRCSSRSEDVDRGARGPGPRRQDGRGPRRRRGAGDPRAVPRHAGRGADGRRPHGTHGRARAPPPLPAGPRRQPDRGRRCRGPPARPGRGRAQRLDPVRGPAGRRGRRRRARALGGGAGGGRGRVPGPRRGADASCTPGRCPCTTRECPSTSLSERKRWTDRSKAEVRAALDRLGDESVAIDAEVVVHPGRAIEAILDGGAGRGPAGDRAPRPARPVRLAHRPGGPRGAPRGHLPGAARQPAPPPVGVPRLEKTSLERPGRALTRASVADSSVGAEGGMARCEEKLRTSTTGSATRSGGTTSCSSPRPCWRRSPRG